MSKQKPTVLVVEDETLLLQAITRKLELSGIIAVACPSGQMAIDTLRTLPEIPDIIWLDYHLKDMDGISFMAMLKDTKGWEKIPVVVVSNSASTQNVHSMLALGAKQYLLKAEHRLEDIVDTIQKLIQEEYSTI